MTEYGFAYSRQMVYLSQDVQEKKTARRKLIEQIEQRRRENYKRFLQKCRLQASELWD